MVYTTDKINELTEAYDKSGVFPKVFFRNIYGERKSGILFSCTYEEMTEYAKCANDIVYFATKYCKILTHKGIHHIHLRPYQAEMLLNYQQHRFFSIFSSRQMGVTTMMNIVMLHELVFGYDKSIILASCKLLQSQESLDRVREMYRNLPFFLKPGMLKADTRNLVMENGNRLVVVSGKTPTVGFQVHRAFLTDFGAYNEETADNFLLNLFPVMSAIKDTKLVISATGRSNLAFIKLIQDSERKPEDPQKNSFFTQRIYWWEIPERDEKWKELEIKNLGSPEKFGEEYDLIFTAK